MMIAEYYDGRLAYADEEFHTDEFGYAVQCIRSHLPKNGYAIVDDLSNGGTWYVNENDVERIG